jgi:hypothetical protein
MTSSNAASIIGGNFDTVSSSPESSIIGGVCNCITDYSCDSSIIGGVRNRIVDGSLQSAIIGGFYNIVDDSNYSSVIGGRCDEVCNSGLSSVIGGSNNCIDNSDYSSILGGCCNCISYNSDYSSIIGGYCNTMCCADCSTILGGYDNRICGDSDDVRGSSIVGGIYNVIYEGSNNSSIIGGYSNDICCESCHSIIIGGCDNRISCCSINSSIIGGVDNCMCCSCNSVILGGQGLDVCGRDNTVFLNATTNFKQTIEASETVDISGATYSINFLEGSIKYINSTSTDFQVDFTNVPAILNTTITYTLIINQGATPYMVTGVTVNTTAQTIKWANATEPEGNASQVDIVGLMFIFNGSGTLTQVLGQMGTFA